MSLNMPLPAPTAVTAVAPAAAPRSPSPRSPEASPSAQTFRFQTDLDDLGVEAVLGSRNGGSPRVRQAPALRQRPESHSLHPSSEATSSSLLPEMMPRDPSADLTAFQVPLVNARPRDPQQRGTAAPTQAAAYARDNSQAAVQPQNFAKPLNTGSFLAAAAAAAGNNSRMPQGAPSGGKRLICLHYTKGELPGHDLAAFSGGQGSPVVVQLIAPGGRAAAAGVKAGAVLHSINGTTSFKNFPGWQVHAMLQGPVSIELEQAAASNIAPGSPRCKEIRLTRKSEMKLGVAPRTPAWTPQDHVMLAEEVVFKPGSAPLWLCSDSTAVPSSGSRSKALAHAARARSNSPTVYELRRPEAHRLVGAAIQTAWDTMEKTGQVASFPSRGNWRSHRGSGARSQSPLCGLEACLPEWANEALGIEDGTGPAQPPPRRWNWPAVPPSAVEGVGGNAGGVSGSVGGSREGIATTPPRRSQADGQGSGGSFGLPRSPSSWQAKVPSGLPVPATELIGSGISPRPRSPSPPREQVMSKDEGSDSRPPKWAAVNQLSPRSVSSRDIVKPPQLESQDSSAAGTAPRGNVSPLRWLNSPSFNAVVASHGSFGKQGPPHMEPILQQLPAGTRHSRGSSPTQASQRSGSPQARSSVGDMNDVVDRAYADQMMKARATVGGQLRPWALQEGRFHI
eukprot:TRINITY_DN23511_c0_g2_i2.p1 TRINITY_DN23511_c0_g2~~TRINITY_DN23511_c0_g2_i2.p1  ORF type:complete len:678 (+),score=104.54 TRINITY_DN23511_c0_g2_i2:24-2057(+)